MINLHASHDLEVGRLVFLPFVVTNIRISLYIVHKGIPWYTPRTRLSCFAREVAIYAPHLFFRKETTWVQQKKFQAVKWISSVYLGYCFPPQRKTDDHFGGLNLIWDLGRCWPTLFTGPLIILKVYPAMLTLKKISPVFNSYCEIASFSTGKWPKFMWTSRRASFNSF